MNQKTSRELKMRELTQRDLFRQLRAQADARSEKRMVVEMHEALAAAGLAAA